MNLGIGIVASGAIAEVHAACIEAQSNAHFAQVTRRFIEFYKKQKIPNWEITNMLTKYHLTTTALELAQGTD